MAPPHVGFRYCLLALVVVAVAGSGVLPAAEEAESSRDFMVGGVTGWAEPPASDNGLYDLWASKLRFLVGDTIYFEYEVGDSVLEVDKPGYYHCNATAPIESLGNGTNGVVFELNRPGLFYFISGAPDHCKHGQRLAVDVMGPHRPQAAPPGSPPDGPAAFPPASASPSALPTGGAGVSTSWSTHGVMVAVALGAAAVVF